MESGTGRKKRVMTGVTLKYYPDPNMDYRVFTKTIMDLELKIDRLTKLVEALISQENKEAQLA